MSDRTNHWRRTAKIVSTTFLVTSAGWLIGGAILFDRLRQSDAPAPRVAVAEAGRTPTSALASAVTARVDVPWLRVPVAGVSREQLVDTFTQSREGGARLHNAIDIIAPRGTPVVAAAAGTVEKLFVSGRGGNTVYLRSPSRTLIYYYAHLDAYAPGLTEGLAVRQGQAIGTVGSTGDADPAAPHLHFEIQQTGAAGGWWQHTASLNPYPYLKRQ